MLLLVFSLPAVAQAEEGSGSDAERAIRFSGRMGLVGFMEMIDARTPGLWQIRSGVRYIATVRDRDFEGAVELSRQEERHDLNVYVGVSLLGLIDVAGRLPYVWDKTDDNLKGTTDIGFDDDWEDGIAGVDLAGKISLSIGPFQIAPFLYGRLPSESDRSVKDLGELDYGTAITFTALNHYLSLHANLAGVQIEEGTVGFRYRLGVAFVLWSSPDWIFRVFAYGNGIEYEGSGDSDIDVDVGVQALVFGSITVELGFSMRVVDAGHIEADLKRDVRSLQSAGRFVDKHFEDDGTWAVQIGIGTVF